MTATHTLTFLKPKTSGNDATKERENYPGYKKRRPVENYNRMLIYTFSYKKNPAAAKANRRQVYMSGLRPKRE